MIAPLMSTSLRSSGIAVISFDFSAHATCPSESPNSLAQMLTECKAPRPFLRSWLRRSVLPSTARMGCSTPVVAAAAARNDVSQVAKHAWKAPGPGPSRHAGRRLYGGCRWAGPARRGGTAPSRPPTERSPWARRRCQHRQHGNDDHADQRVLQIDGGARVLQFREMRDDLIQGDPFGVRHGWFSVWSSRGQLRHRDLYTQNHTRAQAA